MSNSLRSLSKPNSKKSTKQAIITPPQKTKAELTLERLNDVARELARISTELSLALSKREQLGISFDVEEINSVLDKYDDHALLTLCELQTLVEQGVKDEKDEEEE